MAVRRSKGSARARGSARPAAAEYESCACVTDLEEIARRRLHPSVYDYYAGGSEDEQTLAANREAFRHVFLRPRALVGVSTVDPSTSVLGTPVSMPVLIAPTAYQRMAHPDGEIATARAAGAAETLMVASTIATSSLEEIAEAATGPLWFQLYVSPERDICRDLLHRAEAAGYRAICLTVDTPVLGRRERDVRNRFALPQGLSLRNFEGDLARFPRTKTGSGFAAAASRLIDASSFITIDGRRALSPTGTARLVCSSASAAGSGSASIGPRTAYSSWDLRLTPVSFCPLILNPEPPSNTVFRGSERLLPAHADG
jgi:isopentenyl diphosphate isomerase/L-lactate dehydrogenase-like FMN-dependent dehydrogenase